MDVRKDPTLKCLGDDVEPSLLDRESFLFRHRLVGHSALSLENLCRVIPGLPAPDVYSSSGRLSEGDNLDTAHLDHPNRLSIERALAEIQTSNSYVMVRSPEQHPSFADLHADLMADVASVIRARGLDGTLYEPRLYLFIASPGSVTPFHIDRYSTFLLQFSGSKEIGVFPVWDPRVASPQAIESYVLQAGGRPTWSAVDQSLVKRWQFSPGQGLHIPFVAGHYVKNGMEAPSISMSFIFKTAATLRAVRALSFNHRARRITRVFGFEPRPVGQSPARDDMKASLYGAVASLARSMRGGRAG